MSKESAPEFMSNDEILAAIEHDMPACVWEHEEYNRLLAMIRVLHVRAKAAEQPNSLLDWMRKYPGRVPEMPDGD